MATKSGNETPVLLQLLLDHHREGAQNVDEIIAAACMSKETWGLLHRFMEEFAGVWAPDMRQIEKADAAFTRLYRNLVAEDRGRAKACGVPYPLPYPQGHGARSGTGMGAAMRKTTATGAKASKRKRPRRAA